MTASYHIPAQFTPTEIDVKKSRFIAQVKNVNHRQEAMIFLEQAKKTFPDARHHCWAYLIGNPHSVSSATMNDGGEPSGTAGKPVLNVIQYKNVGDVMVIVIRYFDGIKLSVGGLTRAYSSAAEAVLSMVTVKEKIAMTSMVLECDFSQEQFVRHWLSQNQATVCSVEYGERVKLGVELAESSLDEFKKICEANKFLIVD